MAKQYLLISSLLEKKGEASKRKLFFILKKYVILADVDIICHVQVHVPNSSGKALYGRFGPREMALSLFLLGVFGN